MDVLQVFGQFRSAGQTLVIVTHDDRVAATANRVVRMRDGVLAGQPRPTDGPPAALTRAEEG
jgi:putative ABC transport system ATP-binding protein